MIGRNISELRKKKGMTLSELAKRSKVSKSYLSNIERNSNQNPSISVIEKIAMVLGVNVQFLLTHNHEKLNEPVDREWKDFISELKKAGINKKKIHEYKELIEFIRWKTNKGS